jgi:hypothetical protein
MIRAGYFGSANHFYFDPAYLTLVCLAITFLALVALRYVRGQVAVR